MIDRVIALMKDGIHDHDDRELLGSSLFYYCSGNDPTPIVSFGDKYPLYVYSDILMFAKDRIAFVGMLYCELEKRGFTCREKKEVTAKARFFCAEVSLWNTPDGGAFVLVFSKEDAEKTFNRLYYDEQARNTILPKCICNYRFEFDGRSKYEWDFFHAIEKRTEYILGYESCDKYKHIDTLIHVLRGEKVKLYHRMFYYQY